MEPCLIYNTHFLQFTGLLSVFTTSITGDEKNRFNLSLNSGNDQQNVISNREKLFSKLNIDKNNIVWEFQTHSTNISYVDKPCSLNDNDGLITDKPNLFLIVTIADCIPIHIFDKQRKIIASLHSGWRGTKDKILLKCIIRLIEEFKSNPKDLFFYFGPSICKNHFEVDEDVAILFDEKYLTRKNKKFLVDLIQINLDILNNFKVPLQNIMVSKLCTYSQKNMLHSYRRDKDKSGRMLGILGMRG